MAWRVKEMNLKRCFDRSRVTKRTGSVRFTVVSQIVLWEALLEWGKNEELEVPGSALVVSFLMGRAPFLPAASNKFIFDSV
jgi:hypothetical protein